MLMAVVHSHRHNKDEVAAEHEVNFGLVRDTMYKYSKHAQRRFFESPALAFLFAWFASNGAALQFTETKYLDKGPEYLDRIRSEIDALRGQALELLA